MAKNETEYERNRNALIPEAELITNAVIGVEWKNLRAGTATTIAWGKEFFKQMDRLYDERYHNKPVLTKDPACMAA